MRARGERSSVTRLYTKGAGGWARAGQRALWGIEVSADLMVGATLPGSDRHVWTGVGSLQWASRQALGAHQRALGAQPGGTVSINRSPGPRLVFRANHFSVQLDFNIFPARRPL